MISDYSPESSWARIPFGSAIKVKLVNTFRGRRPTQGGIGRGMDIEGGARRNLKVPILPDGDFFGRFREIFFIPRTESQGFLKIGAEGEPERVEGGGLTFKNAPITLFPQGPENKARKKDPEGIEDGRRVRAVRPETKSHGNIPSRFVLLATKAAFFPQRVGQRAQQEKMLDGFRILQAIRTLGRSSEASFDKVVPRQDSFVA